MSKNLDWANIGFGYHKTDKRFVSIWKDGKWDDGAFIDDDMITMSECAGVLQYSQTVFEGLKAYTAANGKIVLFRPNLNAERLQSSCERMCMPVFPQDKFVEAVIELVRQNKEWVPPYGSGASLYIRPYMFGKSPVLGVHSADEFEFRIFCSPVGPYFKGGAKSIRVRISDYDRAAPHGTGHIKAGLNYAMSLYAITDAHEKGFAENVYLDAGTRTYIEETGGANIVFVTKDGELVTPKSPTILPSITRRSLVACAEKYCGVKVTERPVRLDEIGNFVECGLCGTAAVISPIKTIVDHDKEYNFVNSQETYGPVLQKIYDTLVGIQQCRIEGPEGWVYTVD